MKLWIDAPQRQSLNRNGTNESDSQWYSNTTSQDCDADCELDCDCTSHESFRPRIHPILTAEGYESLRTHTFEQAKPLHIQPCTSEHWLVCNPTGSGQMAVVDQHVTSLLDQFRTPNTLKAIEKRSEYLPGSVEQAAMTLYQLGFLNDVHSSPSLPAEQHNTTLTAWLHVTNACNLRCDYCYLHKNSERMADDTAYRAIDAIFRSAARQQFKRVKLKYAGGEASLQMNHVTAMHDYATQVAKEQGTSIGATLLSNGVFLSQNAINNLQARQIGVMISLDGVGTYHDRQRPFISGRGSFKYVDRTITRLLNSGLIPSISVTVSQRNLDGLTDLISYILERDLPFTFNYYRDNACSEHLQDLQFGEAQMIAAMRSVFQVIEQRLPRRSLLGSLIDKANLNSPHRHTCGVGNNYLVIDQHGGVAKCQADIQRTVTTIDADDPLQIIRNDRRGVQGFSVEDKEGCRSCQWRYWCAGGCPLLTYRATGRYDIKSPNCNIYQALFPDALHLEALRLLQYGSPITV